MRSPGRLALLLAGTLACHGDRVSVPQEAPRENAADRGSAADKSDTIAAEFRRIADEVEGSDNFYWGKLPLEHLRAALAEAPTKEDEFDVRVRIAQELLKLGDAEGALPELERCLALVEELHLPLPARRLVLRQLALTHLRAGENQNCVLLHDPDSCIFPIQSGGVHIHKEHATKAFETYLACLELAPESRGARWLLNVAAMQAGIFPDRVPEALRIPRSILEPGPPNGGVPRFVNVAQELEIHDHDLAGGAVVEDFDGDGFLDIMFSTCDPRRSLAFYRSRGDGTFENATRRAGLDVELGGLNLMQTDFDNDGRADVLVLRGGWQGSQGAWRMSLLRNDGGTFTDVTIPSGLGAVARPTQTAAWADYDGDGDLDLYVGNEIDTSPVAGFDSVGEAYPSTLWRSSGDGTFTDVSVSAGVENLRMAKGVAWGDYDDDGDPDLYVSNIGANRLYENLGNGTFRDVAPALGVTRPEARSFATWFWDYDNDGHLDIFVAGFQADVEAVASAYLGEPVEGVVRSKLYHNRGDGTFEEVAAKVGLNGVYLPMGANYGDIDNDGWLDLYLGTGDPSYETLVPNVMLRNVRGEHFEDVTFAGGFGHLEKGHGIAFGDLDNDGDQEVVLQVGGFFLGDRSSNAVFENPGGPNHWVCLRLAGRRSNRAGFGARITLVVSGEEGRREIHVLGGTGGSFGASSLQQEIGLGRATRIEELAVTWPGSGTTQRFHDVPMDAFLEVRESDDALVPLSRRRVQLAHP